MDLILKWRDLHTRDGGQHELSVDGVPVARVFRHWTKGEEGWRWRTLPGAPLPQVRSAESKNSPVDAMDSCRTFVLANMGRDKG